MTPEATQGYIASAGFHSPVVAYWLAVALEIGGGLLLFLGLGSKTVALVLAGFCVVTAGSFHHNLGDHNTMVYFMKDIALAGGLLQIVAFGGGICSLDNLFFSRKP